MLDHQSVFILGFILFGALVVFLYSRHHNWNVKLSKALSYQESFITHGHGTAVMSLVLLAKALNKPSERNQAIQTLVSLATDNNNMDAFLALRDHINPRVLRRVLTTWHTNNPIQELLGRGDLKPLIQGEATGRANSMKLICFAVGTRTIQHLDADLTGAERIMLNERFEIQQSTRLTEQQHSALG